VLGTRPVPRDEDVVDTLNADLLDMTVEALVKCRSRLQNRLLSLHRRETVEAWSTDATRPFLEELGNSPYKQIPLTTVAGRLIKLTNTLNPSDLKAAIGVIQDMIPQLRVRSDKLRAGEEVEKWPTDKERAGELAPRMNKRRCRRVGDSVSLDSRLINESSAMRIPISCGHYRIGTWGEHTMIFYVRLTC
jgi:hypothetical protein